MKPIVTREMRERARTIPNNWLHVYDPAYPEVSAEGVIGRYLVDANGQITDEYVPNPRYLPKDITFDNDLESLMYLVRHGRAEKRELAGAVLTAELVLPADPTREPREHLVMRGSVIDAFASRQALPADWPPHWQEFVGIELAVLIDRMGEPVTIELTGQAGVRLEIPGELLVEGLRAAAGE